MKIQNTKSLFSDGNPHYQIIEPYTLDDFDIIEREPNFDISKINNKWGKSHFASLYLLPKDHIVKELDEKDLNHFQKNDHYVSGAGEHKYNYSRQLSKKFNFKGTRDEDGRVKRYTDTFNQFVENFQNKRSEILQKMLGDVNESLLQKVLHSNKNYTEDHRRLFVRREYEENVWNEYFQKEDEYQSINDNIQDLERQIKELKKKRKVFDKKMDSLKNEVVSRELESSKLPKEVKDILGEELKENPWKTTRGSGWLR